MSINNVSIQVSFFDNGKQGVIDAGDKVSLNFRNEYGQLVKTTKAMSLDEFRKNSLQEFESAFPLMSLFEEIKPQRPVRLQTLLLMGIASLPYSGELLFSTSIAMAMLHGRTSIDTFMAERSLNPWDQSLQRVGVAVSLSIYSRAENLNRMDPFAFFGIKRKQDLTVESLEPGKMAFSFTYPFVNNDKANDGRVYFRENHVVDGKQHEMDAFGGSREDVKQRRSIDDQEIIKIKRRNITIQVELYDKK